MTRRGLFQFFTAAAIAADPDKLLWTPGQRKVFIPSPPKVLLVPSADDIFKHLQLMGHWKKRPNTDASAFGEAHAVLAEVLTGTKLTDPPHMTNLADRQTPRGFGVVSCLATRFSC